jgi:hypothetical protein
MWGDRYGWHRGGAPALVKSSDFELYSSRSDLAGLADAAL